MRAPHTDQSCLRCGQPLLKECNAEGGLELENGKFRKCPNGRLIGGVPASLLGETAAGLPFLSLYRIQAMSLEWQTRLRTAIANHDWWPANQGWVYRPIEEK